MNMKKLFGGLVATLLVAGTAQAASLEMNFQSLYNPAQRQNADALEPWAKSFETASKGDMKMHFFYAGGVVEASDVFNGLKHGMLDAAGWSVMDYHDAPYVYLLGIPYLVKDQAHGYRVFKKIYEEIPEFRDDLEGPGKLLSFAASAPYAIASKDTPIRTPADMAGKRVLVTSGTFGELVEAWGGIPVTVAMGDVYVGLQRGMGEMFICGISCVKGARVQEFCKHTVSLGQSSCGIFPYSINRDLFEKDMTPEQQKLTLELSKDLGINVLNSFLVDVENTWKEFEAAGVKVYYPTEAEMQQWIDKAKAIIPNKVANAKKAGVKNAEEMVKRYYEIAATVE